MILQLLFYATILLLIVSLFVGYRVLKDPILTPDSQWLSKSELGTFERLLRNCEEVILVADEIQVPTVEAEREIWMALVDNFMEGVRYNFVVPAHYYEANHDSIRKKYQNIIRIAQDAAPSAGLSEALFSIYAQPFRRVRKDYPYLFYRFRTPTEDSQIVAFRGEDIGRGIAENYRRLEPEVAETLLHNSLSFIYGPAYDANEYSDFSESDAEIAFKPENENVVKLADVLAERRPLGLSKSR